MYTVTTTPRYIPRHAAPGRLRSAMAWIIRAWRWLSWRMDQPMTGPEMCLAGAALGLLFAKVIFFCYFG